MALGSYGAYLEIRIIMPGVSQRGEDNPFRHQNYITENGLPVLDNGEGLDMTPVAIQSLFLKAPCPLSGCLRVFGNESYGPRSP